MSAPPTTPAVRMCPNCLGAIEASQTICADCRAKLEAEVLAVRANDYPLPPESTSERTDGLGVPVAAAMDPQLAEAVVADHDLLPLAPMDETRRPASPASPAPLASPVEPIRPKAKASPARSRPEPPVPVVIDRPVSLETPNRAKLIIILILCVVVTGVLAAFLWSSIVPPAEPDAPPVAISK